MNEQHLWAVNSQLPTKLQH